MRGELTRQRPGRVATLPFDHARRAASTLVDDGGAPDTGSQGRPRTGDGQLRGGARFARSPHWRHCSPTVAAWWRSPAGRRRSCPPSPRPTRAGLTLDGFLVFADEPKAAARESLARLAALGIEVKVATGDNPQVAEKVCADLGLASKGTDHRR